MSFDPEQAARQLIASHKVVDSEVILPFMLYRQKAELDDENFLASHGYLWAQKNGWYLNEEENSAVVYLHNRRFIWVYGSLAKIFQNPDKFYAWLDNDAKNFTSQIIKLSKAANAHMNESITQSNLHTLIRGIIRTILKEVADSSYYGQDAMRGGKPDEQSRAFWKADHMGKKAFGKDWALIKLKSGDEGTVYAFNKNVDLPITMDKLTKTGKISQFLWKTTKNEWKMLDPKTKKWVDITPTDTGNPSENVEEMTGTGAVSATQSPAAFSKRTMEEGKIQDPTKEEMLDFLRSQFGNEEGFEGDAEVAMYWFANFNHGGQSSNLYSVLSTSDFSPGPMARGPMARSSEEFMYQALEDEFGEGGGEEHSIDDGEHEIAEDESGLNRAARRDLSKKLASTDTSSADRDAQQAGMAHLNKTNPSAAYKLDSERRRKLAIDALKETVNESFKPIQKIYKDRQGGQDVYTMDNGDGGKIRIKPESINKYLRQGAEIIDLNDPKVVKEMTTTGAVDGYNIPSAFSKKGGSVKGVAGSAALGYTLTAAGKKEMERSGDRLLENGNAKQRCSKCKQLKPTDAHGYIEGWECYDCRKSEKTPSQNP